MTRYDEFPFGAGLSLNELRDANAECLAHGRCAFDRTPPCGCFPSLERGRPVKRLPRQMFELVEPLENPCPRCQGSGSEWKRRKDGRPDRRYLFPIGPCVECNGSRKAAA